MSRSTVLPIALAVASLLGCAGAQTKSPIVTRSEDGKSVSPSGDAAAKRGTSLVRFVNALPGSGKLTVHADERDLFSGIEFKAVTTYQELRDNLTKFPLRRDDAANEMATNSEAMTDGYRYTIVALSDEKGGASLRVFRDEVVPDSGKARIRLIHAAPGLADVDLAVVGQREPLFNDINYSMEAGFKDIDPTTVTFEIRHDKGQANLVRLPKMILAAGRAYTIILTGMAPNKLTAVTFDDTATPGAIASVGGAR